MPFSKTKVALKANSMDDLLRAGLQIFTMSGDYAAHYNDPDIDRISKATDDRDTMTQLATLIRSGKVIWENQARGLNPNIKLAEMMGMKLAVPALAARLAVKRGGLAI